MLSCFSEQKRRSGRQVKRRKYNEDLDFKVVDDDGETIAVLGTGRMGALSASTLAWQAEVTVTAADGSLPSCSCALLLSDHVVVTLTYTHMDTSTHMAQLIHTVMKTHTHTHHAATHTQICKHPRPVIHIHLHTHASFLSLCVSPPLSFAS